MLIYIISMIGSEPLVRGFALGYRFLILCASHKPPRCRKTDVSCLRNEKAHDDVTQREHDASPKESYEMQRAWHLWARIARLAIQVRR